MSRSLFKNVCDEHIFSNLYEKYGKDLHDFIYYKYGEQFNPSDKTQEAFIKLWQNCKTVSIESAKSFLFTVINNLTLNDIKHKKVVQGARRSSHGQFSKQCTVNCAQICQADRFK